MNGRLLSPSSAFSNNVPQEAQSTYLDHYYKVDFVRRAVGVREVCYAVDWRDPALGRFEIADYVKKLAHFDMNAGFTFYEPFTRTAGTVSINRVGRRGFVDREMRILDFLRPHFSNYHALLSRAATFPMNAYTAAELTDACRLLSRREAEIASLLCRRLRPNEIATVLLISPRTVERHIENIYSKLGVRCRKELLTRLLKGLCAD